MLIKNGYLFTTCTNDFEKLDIRIENTKITEVDYDISPKENEEVIDAAGNTSTGYSCPDRSFHRSVKRIQTVQHF